MIGTAAHLPSFVFHFRLSVFAFPGEIFDFKFLLGENCLTLKFGINYYPLVFLWISALLSNSHFHSLALFQPFLLSFDL